VDHFSIVAVDHFWIVVDKWESVCPLCTFVAERYGKEGVDNKKELQIGIIRVGDKNWGYLTPGWGQEGSTFVNPTELYKQYIKAGLKPNYWMHGHWDKTLNFSATDFGLVWKNFDKTFLVNRNIETRVLTDKHIKKAMRRMRAKIKSLSNLQAELAEAGLPGDIL